MEQLIYILHIESATKACSVALSKNGKLIALREENALEFMHGESLTLFIDEVIKESGIQYKEISAVSISSGPGSYTGLRIGVSTAKGLCFALDIPLIAIDTLFSLAQVASSVHQNMNLCPVIDARRMEVYNAIYTSQLTPLKNISADIINETSYDEYEPFVYFGDGAQKLENIFSQRNTKIDTSIFASAVGQIPKAFEKYLNQEFENLAYYEPFYLKDFIGTQK